jgi:hypothetical protein
VDKEPIRPFQHVKAGTILAVAPELGVLPWFISIRHPYELVRSWYAHHRSHVFYPPSFEEWVLAGCHTHWERPEHRKLNPWWDGTNPLHQIEWFAGDDIGVIRHEHLAEGLRWARMVLGRRGVYGIPKLNAATAEVKHTRQTKAMVRRLFADDFYGLKYD